MLTPTILRLHEGRALGTVTGSYRSLPARPPSSRGFGAAPPSHALPDRTKGPAGCGPTALSAPTSACCRRGSQAPRLWYRLQVCTWETQAYRSYLDTSPAVTAEASDNLRIPTILPPEMPSCKRNNNLPPPPPPSPALSLEEIRPSISGTLTAHLGSNSGPGFNVSPQPEKVKVPRQGIPMRTAQLCLHSFSST